MAVFTGTKKKIDISLVRVLTYVDLNQSDAMVGDPSSFSGRLHQDSLNGLLENMRNRSSQFPATGSLVPIPFANYLHPVAVRELYQIALSIRETQENELKTLIGEFGENKFEVPFIALSIDKH